MSAKAIKEWTLMHQGNLPPLPLPELGQTCDKYLRSVQPVLTEDEYRHTKFVVDTFRTGIGKVLHEKLKLRAKDSKNWLAEWWADTYVDYRGPLPYFSNFGGTTDYSAIWQQPEIGSQVYRASMILHTLLQKHLKIQRQQWPISMLRKKIPMDMILFYGFFASGRLPGYERDLLVNYSIKDGSPSCTMRHIVVIKRRRFYTFHVMTPSYEVISPPEIEMQLQRISELADARPLGPGVGSLTSTDRPTWKKVQDHLFSLDPKNEEIVDVINKALVVCILDDCAPGSQNASTFECVIGDSSNRWYDKGNQCIFFKDGFIGNNNDHAHIDGFMSSEIFEDVLEDVMKCKGKWQGSNDIRELPWPVELEFKVDDYVMGEIEIARNKHETVRTAARMIDKPIMNFGKRFAKEVTVHPDAMIQMAIQLAYYRMHQRCVPTYETATTRQFHIGRTETLRVCTVESKRFVEAMDAKNSTSTKVKLLREACETHGKMMDECTNGQGIDRHLLGLRNIAMLEGFELPKIYVDKAWKASGGDANFVLSTSLSGYRTVHGGMGPMTLDGYGIFYTIENDRIHVVVGTIDSEKTDCYRMREEIEKAFYDMREILIAPKL